MEAFSILSLAIGLFGATFTAIGSLQRFFHGYVSKANKRAKDSLDVILDNSLEGNSGSSRLNYYGLKFFYCVWVLALFFTIVVFSFFAFKFSFEISGCENLSDTEGMWKKYLGYIRFMRTSFIVCVIAEFVSLVAIGHCNSVLEGMRGMTEVEQAADPWEDEDE